MNAELVRDLMVRYWDGDTELIAEDAEYTMLATGEVVVGREAIRQMIRDFYHGTFEAQVSERSTYFSQDHAMFEGLLVGVQRRTFAGWPVEAREVRLPMCVIYDLADGKISRARVYIQTEGLRASFEASN
jgi:ketosteroid isomerase-like protein